MSSKKSKSSTKTIASSAEKNGAVSTIPAEEKERRPFRLNFAWLYKDRSLAIIALILSIFLWSVLTLNVGASSTKTITDVPITIDTADIEETFGLTMITIVDPPALNEGKVDVVLNGSVYQLSKVTADDVSVTAAVSGVNRAGEATLGLAASCSKREVSAKVVNNYDFVKVWFDRIQRKKLTVDKIIVNGVSPAEEDMMIGDYVSSIKNLTIEGPESVIENIVSVQISADVNEALSESASPQGTLAFLDEDGNVYESEKTSYIAIVDYNDIGETTGTPAGAPAAEDISIIVPVNRVITVPLGLTFKNVPEGFDTASLRYTISPSKITIEGDVDAINKISEAGIYFAEAVDLSNLSSGKNTYLLELNLSTGFEEVNGISQVNVAFDVSGYASKKLTLGSGRFSLANASGIDAGILTDTLDVTVFGPVDFVDNVTAEDITVVADMTDYDGTPGQRKMTAGFRIKNTTNVWVIGSYTLVVNVN